MPMEQEVHVSAPPEPEQVKISGKLRKMRGPNDVDVHDKGDCVTIDADATGFPKDTVRVLMDGNQITIQGFSSTNEEDLQGHVRQPFKRVVDLPSNVDPDHIKAKWEEGMIHLVLDKLPHDVSLPHNRIISLQD